MMKKKRIAALLLSLMMVLSILSGCAGEAPAQDEPQEIIQKSDEPAETPAESAETPEAPEADADVQAIARAVMDEKPDHSYMVGAEDVFAAIDNGDDFFVLDIRQPDVYAEGHIKGAVNVPWGPEFGSVLENLPADKPIYLYCYTGQTAGQTVGMLNFAGYEAYSVRYGWNLGVSQTEGFEGYTETEANEFGDEETLAVDPAVKDAFVAYYEGLADVAGGTFANYKISEDNAKALLDEGAEDVIFLSIRRYDDYKDQHIPGALNAPYGQSMISDIEAMGLPMDQKVIINCYSGQTAGQAVAIMRLLGYDAVSLNFGMGTDKTPGGWANKGFETVDTVETANFASTDVAAIARAVMDEKPDHSYMVGAEDVFAAIDNGEDFFVLDIRQPDVYAEGHIKGAVNVPWGPEFGSVLENLPADKPIYLYCYTGQTAGQTVGMLNFAGYEAYSVRYGWNLGVSQTEGFEGYTETEANEFGDEEILAVDPAVKDAFVAYYEGLADVAGDTFANYKISEDNAKALLDEGAEDVIFLSIRRYDDYKDQHIPGALNAPYGQSMISDIEAMGLPMDQKVIVNCYSGQTAGQAVAIMRLLGYDAVSLNFGMGTDKTPGGWANKGFETVDTVETPSF